MAVVHKILRGRGAGELLPFARAKLDRLAAECDRSRAPARSKQFVVHHGGGTFDIAVQVLSEQHYIKIKRRPCPPFLSGFCDLVIYFTGNAMTPVYQVDNPDPPPATAPTFRRFYPSPAIAEPPPRAWRDEPRLAKSTEAAEQMVVLKASMFSGEMRKVVQIHQGQGRTIPYSPTYALTHGVFTAVSGQRWVVEVSNQGVVAWVMGMCRNPIYDVGGEVLLEYHPILTPKPEDEDLEAAISAGTFVTLLDADGIREFYNAGGPFFTHCGWAFNSNGSRAANVCFTTIGETKYSYLYELRISEVEGRPATATLSSQVEGWLHGPKLLAFIDYPDGQGSLYSFDMFYDNPVNIEECHSPVYVYYDGAQRVDVLYHNAPNTGHTESYSEFGDMPGPAGSGCDCFSDSDIGTVFRQGTLTYQPQPSFSFPDHTARNEYLSVSSVSERRYTGITRLGQSSQPAANSPQVSDQFRVQDERRTGVTDFEVVNQVIIVPIFEREAFYFAERVRDYRSQVSHSQNTHLVFGADQFEKIVLETCAGSPGQVVTYTTGGLAANICPSAGQPGCPGGRYTTQGFQTLYFPQEIGTPVTIALQNEGGGGTCAVLGGTTEPFTVSSSLPTETVVSTTYTVEYRPSGASRRALPVSPDVDRLFEFLEPGFNSGSVVSVRDAFVAGKYVISTDIRKIRGSECLSTAADYPVNEAGNNMSFIGVP